jgi:dynein heavy chain
MPNCVTVSEQKKEDGTPVFKNSREVEFKRYNKTMDQIEKNLGQYLELKRQDFARFYFISNEELLTLLANQAKMEIMQTYLGNLFEGIYKFVLD